MSLTCANITNFFPFISKARIVGPGDGKMTVSMNPLNTLSAQSPAPTPPRAELLRAGGRFCFGQHSAYTKGRGIASNHGWCAAERMNSLGRPNAGRMTFLFLMQDFYTSLAKSDHCWVTAAAIGGPMGLEHRCMRLAPYFEETIIRI